MGGFTRIVDAKGTRWMIPAARGQVMGCEGVMAQAGLEKEKHPRFRKCLIINVEVVGFEPATPCLQGRCSTS